MPVPLLAALFLLAPPRLDFYSHGPYDANVPRPESILGYGPGDRITTYHDQERVVNAIAGRAGNKVRRFAYGKSVQGRELRVFAISSAKNIANLEKIRANQVAMSDGKPGDSKMPVVVWINECIHGNEPASFESAMWLMYNLAATSAGSIAKSLDDVVVILNPVYNPDGHERFAVWYDAIAVGATDEGAYEFQEPSVIHGRTNAFRVDMNRDRVSFSQDETRAEFAEMLRWHPQVYVDQHGQVGTYFFPPNPESINENVDRARMATWTDYFGRAIGKSFDATGFQYFSGDTYDLYYPGYVDSSVTLSGAIGMTHETDGGKYLNKVQSDGYVLTLRRGIEKHFTSALAVIQAAALKRQELVKSSADFQRKAVSGESAGKFQRVVVVSEDPRPLGRLQQQLSFGGIRSSFATKAWSQEDATNYWTDKRGKADFPVGSLVIDIAQAQGALAKALLEPGSNFEESFIKAQVGKKNTAPEGEDYPGPDGTEFYELTGWSLPFAHGLKAWWCESAPAVLTTTALIETSKALGPSAIGYALRYTDQEDILAAAEIMRSGVRGSVTTKPISVGGETFDRGTFLFLADRNDDRYAESLVEVARRRGVKLVALSTSYADGSRYSPGSDYVAHLRAPKIGVVFGTGPSLADVSGVWYAMSRLFKLPFTPLSGAALGGDLSAYTTIVVPSGGVSILSSKLKDWISAGGNLVVLGNFGWAVGSSSLVELDSAKGEPQRLPGSIFRAWLDARSPLSYGYPSPKEGKIEVAVYQEGSRFYSVRKQGGSVVTLGDEKTRKLLSGWAWPDDTEKNLANTVWLQDAPVGRGHAYLFATDPTARAMWPGVYKMLLNAMILN